MRFHKKTLPSGLKIITSPMSGTEAMTLLVLVGTGSKYETKNINGISHFLEHLFFKGTEHHPNAGDVHRALDRIGSEHNAFTGQEVTGYWVKAAGKHFDTALDIVSDILIEPLFKPEEIERERGVILQEISMYEDMPQRKVVEVWEELLYGDQPAGRGIAGTPDTIRKIKREDILKYKNSQYVASNSLVVAAGNIDRALAEKKISRAFKKFVHGRAKPKKRVKESQAKPAVGLEFKKTDQTHVVVGFRGYNMHDKRRYALGLLGVILGGNTSSRLFSEIREKLGLAYYVGAAPQSYTDTGYLAASAGIPHGELSRVVKKIIEIFADLKENGITEEELKFAKDYLRGTMALSFESSDEIASFYGEQALFYKNVRTPHQIFRDIENVSKNDILKVIKDIINYGGLNLAAIGPHKNPEKLSDILKQI